MTDAQMIGFVATVGIVFIGVLTGVLMNNHRLNDIKELLRAEIKASEGTLHAEIKASEGTLRVDMAELRSLMEKNHSELLLKFAEMDTRLSKLEGERRVIG